MPDFAFLGHYTKYVTLSACVATPVYGVMVWNWGEKDHPWHTEFLPAAYGLFLMVWSAAFLQGWKREDSALAIRWGLENERQSLESKVRVQYYGIPRDSPVRVDLHGTAAQEVWYPTWMRVIKYVLTCTIVAVSLAFVASSLAALVLFRAWLEGIRGPNTLTVIAGGCVSGPVVLLLNGLNTWLARKLVSTSHSLKHQATYVIRGGRALCLQTEFENHRTVGEYENNLIAKRFFFQVCACIRVVGFWPKKSSHVCRMSHLLRCAQFCNSYITLYYIAFFKAFANGNGWRMLGVDFSCADGRARDNDCFEELSIHLLSMFSTQLVIQNIKNVLVPLCSRRGSQPSAASSTAQGQGNHNAPLMDSRSETSPRYIEEACMLARAFSKTQH